MKPEPVMVEMGWRELYAGLALIGLLSKPQTHNATPYAIAVQAVQQADAMLQVLADAKEKP